MAIIARELSIVICYAATFPVAEMAAIVHSPKVSRNRYSPSTICMNYRGSSENAYQPFKIIIPTFFRLRRCNLSLLATLLLISPAIFHAQIPHGSIEHIETQTLVNVISPYSHENAAILAAKL